MKVDETRTKEARKRHAAGVKRLADFFGVNDTFVRRLVPQDQRWLSRSKKARQIYRAARISQDKNWAMRRAKRKQQRRARKDNR